MNSATRRPAPPPSYEEAVTELPTHFELVSMTPAQLEHQAKIEQLKHERRLRAAQIQHTALPRTKPIFPQQASRTQRTTVPASPYSRSSLTAPDDVLQLRLRSITSLPRLPQKQPSQPVSRNALNLSSLLLRIMHADYLAQNPGHPLRSFPFSWADRHMDAIYYSRSYTLSRNTTVPPPVIATRIARIQLACAELEIEYEVVRELMLQHHPQSRRSKFTGDRWRGETGRNARQELAVEMCRDAYQVIPVVVRTDEEATELLEGLVKRVKGAKLFPPGHIFLKGGFVGKIEEMARWYRLRS